MTNSGMKVSSLGLVALALSIGCQIALSQGSSRRQPERHCNRVYQDRVPPLKDAFLEDNSFVVRIRTTYNQSTSNTCNAIVMDEQLVLSDVTCIKYQVISNIDARFVHVITGEPGDEVEYEVEQIYINKADPKDPSTELALLKLFRPIQIDTQCRQLIKPERGYSIELGTSVRMVGFTSNYEFKENRTKLAKKSPSSKYICTSPLNINETPGSQLLRGAPLLHMIDCKQHQLVGIFTKIESVADMPKKQQDCFVVMSTQIRWYEQVKTLSSLAAKNGQSDPSNLSRPPIMVVPDE